MPELSPEVKEDAVRRLRRIEGQARGVQRMIDENRDCHEILHQLTAIRSAAYQASLMLARDYAAQCLKGNDQAVARSSDELVNELLGVLTNMPELVVIDNPNGET
jgi:DNA-binding FrmR family transcriptional regulator